MFNTYVINLDEDIDRFNKLKANFKKLYIHAERFKAINGKKIKDYNKYDKYLSNYSKYFSPKFIIGCGLSHYILLDTIYKKYKNGKENEYSLILEDDVIINIKNREQIEDIIKNIDKDIDILLLFCQGFCNYEKNMKNKYIKTNLFSVSAAAYLVRNDRIPKILKEKLYFHIDLQRCRNKDLNIKIYKDKLFVVNNNNSYNSGKYKNCKIDNYITKIFKLENIKMSMVLKSVMFRIPGLDWELRIYHIHIIFYILLLISIYVIYNWFK